MAMGHQSGFPDSLRKREMKSDQESSRRSESESGPTNLIPKPVNVLDHQNIRINSSHRTAWKVRLSWKFQFKYFLSARKEHIGAVVEPM